MNKIGYPCPACSSSVKPWRCGNSAPSLFSSLFPPKLKPYLWTANHFQETIYIYFMKNTFSNNRWVMRLNLFYLQTDATPRAKHIDNWTLRFASLTMPVTWSLPWQRLLWASLFWVVYWPRVGRKYKVDSLKMEIILAHDKQITPFCPSTPFAPWSDGDIHDHAWGYRSHPPF